MPAQCSICEFPTTEKPRPLLCPSCGRAGTLFEVGLPTDAVGGGKIETLADVPPRNPVALCGVPELDAELGGWGLGSTSVICGSPGAGKSVLSIRVAAGLAKTLECYALLVVPEMSEDMLRRAAGAFDRKVNLGRLVRCKDPERWEDEAEAIGARVVLVDSVSRMPSPLGTLTAMIEFARDVDGVCLALAHMNAKGFPVGSSGLRHDPDAWFRLEKLRKGRLLRVGKPPRWAACSDSIALDQSSATSARVPGLSRTPRDRRPARASQRPT